MLLSRFAGLCLRALVVAVILPSAAVAFAQQPELTRIADAIARYDCITGHVSYEVTLPSAPDPVTYSIDLYAQPAPGDTLAPCNYLIDWTLPRPKRDSKGFAAYYGGHHYRYRDLKLQEYHFAEDPVPFGKDIDIQNRAQFLQLLPAYLAPVIRNMATDSAYQCKVTRYGNTVTVSGVQRVKGYDALEFEYVFNATDTLPVSVDFVYNPASISEQTVTGKYKWKKTGNCPSVSEENLMARYPEVFEKFRTGNFRVQSLRDNHLPEISAMTTGNGRYTHQRDEDLSRPTVLVFLDPAVESARPTVEAIREARDQAMTDFDVLYIFATNKADEAAETVDGVRDGETVLINARSAIRDCGITAYPTIIIADSGAVVKQIITAYNKDLPTVVIQQTALCD